MIFVEQAKDAKDQLLKLTLINRAVGVLNNSKGEPIPQKRATLWFDICVLCWDMKNIDLTEDAAKHVLSYSWDVTRHKQFFLQQAKVHFVLAELNAHQIHTSGFNAGESIEHAKKQLIETEDDIELELKALENVHSQQVQLIESLLAVLSIGSQLKEDFLISQAVLKLNFFI